MDLQAEVGVLLDRIETLKSGDVDKPALLYFDIVGIGWPIRCLLHLGKVEYDYIPVSIMHWAFRDESGQQRLKQAVPSGHLPLYADPTFRSNQSNLIATHLAAQLGFMGSDEAQALRIREVMSHAYDALFHFNGLLPVNIVINMAPDVAQARLDAFMGKSAWGLATNGYRNNLDGFLRYLQHNPADSGYMVGSELTIADLHCFNALCNWYKAFDRHVFTSEYAMLDDYIHRVAAYPGVMGYIREKQEPTVWFPLPDLALRLHSAEALSGLIDPVRTA